MTEVTANPTLTVSASTQTASNNEQSQQQPTVQNYTDGYSYEVPRPFLTLSQAAGILGMTLRSLERSVLGRWGNKLPEGWAARRMKTVQGDEWRILPPPGFRVKLNTPGTESDTTDGESGNMEQQFVMPQHQPATQQPAAHHVPAGAPATTHDATAFYTAAPAGKRKPVWRPERHTLDQPTIVIDRTEEVEHLLRELVSTKSALAEERRLHLEDLRMITQLQGSMRLLEVNAAEQTKLKSELEAARQELNDWKEKYNEVASRPWWRKLFQNRS